MNQISQQKIVMYCKPQDFTRWEPALSFYQVSHASLDEPLEEVLAQAVSNQTDLFVILDGTQPSDDALMSACALTRRPISDHQRICVLRL